MRGPSTIRGQPMLRSLLSSVTVVLKPSASQQTALDELLREQQNPASAQYHKWLTPGEFGSRFGANPADIGKLVAWLQSEHLAVSRVARARNAIVLNGTAEQIGAAFRSE